MKTTAEWWEVVSQSPEKMDDWLKSQYHGEVTASKRIEEMKVLPGYTKADAEVIDRIIADEEKHALWVKQLMQDRGLTPYEIRKEERYWVPTLAEAKNKPTFSYMCAVAHLAETMRLDRIELLAKDTQYKDIAKVFKAILKDELYHTTEFGKLSTPEDIKHAKKFHDIGKNALGLTA